MDLAPVLPAVNALLNATSAVLLVLGYRAIRLGRWVPHMRFMLSAAAASALFLGSYLLTRFLLGVTPYGGTGALRVTYFFILGTHTVLAAAIVPLAAITLWRGLKGRYRAHRRIARWTLPLWLYVSVTGVIVYLMLRPYY